MTAWIVVAGQKFWKKIFILGFYSSNRPVFRYINSQKIYVLNLNINNLNLNIYYHKLSPTQCLCVCFVLRC